jgi:hypothetical protein
MFPIKAVLKMIILNSTTEQLSHVIRVEYNFYEAGA